MNIKKKTWYINSGSSFDPDSTKFFAATGITSPSLKSAVNDALVVPLKSAVYGNLWDNIFTGMPIHPIAGGNAVAHAVNLRNPGTNNITWSGGITHSATGALPNGTTGFGDDGFICSVGQTLNNCGFSYYSGTHNATSAFDMGTNNGGGHYLGCLFGGNNPNVFVAGVTVNGGASRTDGFFTAVNVSSVLDIVYRNGVEIKRTAGSASVGLPTIPQYYMALNNGSAAFFSNREMRFGCKHTGLTAQQAADLFTIVQAFQTALGRAV